MTHVQQVGGDHYQSEQQHWDLIERYDIAYLEATGTKYVVRFRKKGRPTEDLGKGISYFKKLLVERNDGVRRRVPIAAFERFAELNPMEQEEKQILHDVLVDGSRGAIVDVVALMQKLIQSYEAKAA